MRNSELRRIEIMDAAEQLFFEKGYHETKIIDIMNDLGIAKGSFYYYFKTKEAILDAIIQRIVEADIAQAEQIVDDPGIAVFDKLFQVLLGQQPKAGERKERMLQRIHQPGNAEMHQKALVYSILGMVPLLTRIVEQGIREGVMQTEHPRETMEFLVASGQIIFDKGLFQWEQEEIPQKAGAFIQLMERALGAEQGSFDYVAAILLGKAEAE